MRLLFKLATKLGMMVGMVLFMGWAMRHGTSFITQVPGGAGAAGVESPKFSSEEADLMSTVFKSALRLFSGQAKRDELASELSDKLYAGRAGAGEMAELGIELVKPGGDSGNSSGLGNLANALPGGKPGAVQPGARPTAQPGTIQQPTAQPGAAATTAVRQRPAKPGEPAMPTLAGVPGMPGMPGLPTPDLTKNVRTDLLGRIWDQTRKYKIEMGLVPVVLLGMALVHRIRRRRGDDFIIPMVGMMPPADTEPFDMKHDVHSLSGEDFEMLVALIYQRQGYRVSMPAALSGGRGGDFLLLRKSERLLVQCKKLSSDHQVAVERVRELHDAAKTVGATRAMYVASCAFSWDARNFGKAKGMTLINARTLDELLNAAKETPEEDILDFDQWIPRLVAKIQYTPPTCPSCEASMDQVTASAGAVWVCSQRPECRGRRPARKYQKAAAPANTPKVDPAAEAATEQPAIPEPARSAPQPVAKTPVPAPAKSAARPAPQPAPKPAAPSEAKPAPKSTAKPVPVPAAQSAAQFTAYPRPKTEAKPSTRHPGSVRA